MDGFGKVAVGIRLTRPYPAFFHSWSRMLMGGMRPGDQYLEPSIDLPHAGACNRLVEQFLAGTCDSLLFMDDDHIFTPDTLERLRRSPDCDIVYPLVCCRRGQFQPFVMCDVKGEANRVSTVLDAAGMMPVDYVGLGFTLIKRDIIEGVVKMHGTHDVFCFDPAYGEDGNFCRDARMVGARIAVNADILVGHLVVMNLLWDSANRGCNISSVGMSGHEKVSVTVKHTEKGEITWP
jgi:hypothetical protein